MKAHQLPGLPQCAITENNVWTLLDYERNRADYWEARCRVAVEALKEIAGSSRPKYLNETSAIYESDAWSALDAIGDLPPPVDDLPQQQRTGE